MHIPPLVNANYVPLSMVHLQFVWLTVLLVLMSSEDMLKINVSQS